MIEPSPAAESAIAGMPQRSWLKWISGILTLAGLITLAVALKSRGNVDFPVPFILLCVGGAITLAGGLIWASTRGERIFKTIFLGAIGAVCGGLLGGYLDIEMPVGNGDVSAAIWLTLGGSWLGALLVGGAGMALGIAVSRRYRGTNAAG